MRLLNQQYRGIDRTTDVLSFPQYGPDELKAEVRKRSHVCAPDIQASSDILPIGDLVINLHKAQRQALENRISFDEELRRLLVHGMLHLVGYDHEQGGNAARSMQKISRRLIENLR
jgi:probable rRNA maturation factor